MLEIRTLAIECKNQECTRLMQKTLSFFKAINCPRPDCTDVHDIPESWIILDEKFESKF